VGWFDGLFHCRNIRPFIVATTKPTSTNLLFTSSSSVKLSSPSPLVSQSLNTSSTVSDSCLEFIISSATCQDDDDDDGGIGDWLSKTPTMTTTMTTTDDKDVFDNGLVIGGGGSDDGHMYLLQCLLVVVHVFNGGREGARVGVAQGHDLMMMWCGGGVLLMMATTTTVTTRTESNGVWVGVGWG
jgi:hypothetical protein